MIELHGVRYAGKGGGTAWRKFAWGVVILGGLALSQFAALFLIMTNGLLYLGLLSVTLLVMLVALVSTSRADRAGTRRILVSEIGIAMLVPEGKSDTSAGDGFREWEQGDRLRFKHIGRFWSTMDVLNNFGHRVLRVGFRVSADDGPEIETMIRELVYGANSANPANPADPVDLEYDQGSVEPN
ncbi:MAG: hypothetical protein ACIAQF_01575 [Phycisphaerales bacterium JB065]